MQVQATKKYARISSRKVRLVADLVRGMDVEQAEVTLQFTQKGSSKLVLELIRSAAANAEHNHSLDRSNLFVKSIFVNDGPMLKRFRARSQGRAFQILKRMSHIVVILDERVESKKSDSKKALKAEKKTIKKAEKPTKVAKNSEKKTETKKTTK